ncbi:hypothetical protein D9757_001570 [Collybiopsis confluens]|uniref:DUF1748-domain-containing protein n=1 Tax=Collybiopsis confluens TaxID=2823264 RepID=A0A8H5HZ57_9AGAR|nr:hypothetical protein D9757_001570 [Collybiopsis confluens]
MVLGRLFHFTFDAVMVSTVLAGVKKNSGFGFDVDKFSDPTLKSVAEKYFGVGETVFGMIQGTAVNSGYFTNRPSS